MFILGYIWVGRVSAVQDEFVNGHWRFGVHKVPYNLIFFPASPFFLNLGKGRWYCSPCSSPQPWYSRLPSPLHNLIFFPNKLDNKELKELNTLFYVCFVIYSISIPAASEERPRAEPQTSGRNQPQSSRNQPAPLGGKHSTNPKCEPITIPLCTNIEYNMTIMPNLLGRFNLQKWW